MVLWALDKEPDNCKRRKKYLVLSASSHITTMPDTCKRQLTEEKNYLLVRYISISIDINLYDFWALLLFSLSLLSVRILIHFLEMLPSILCLIMMTLVTILRRTVPVLHDFYSLPAPEAGHRWFWACLSLATSELCLRPHSGPLVVTISWDNVILLPAYCKAVITLTSHSNSMLCMWYRGLQRSCSQDLMCYPHEMNSRNTNVK